MSPGVRSWAPTHPTHTGPHFQWVRDQAGGNIFPEEKRMQIVPKVRVAITVHAHRPLCPHLCNGLLGGPRCPAEGQQPSPPSAHAWGPGGSPATRPRMASLGRGAQKGEDCSRSCTGERPISWHAHAGTQGHCLTQGTCLCGSSRAHLMSQNPSLLAWSGSHAQAL